jgi:aromatic-amino-acid transaminase
MQFVRNLPTVYPPFIQLFTHSTHLTMTSLFAQVELAPRDPILGLNEAFNADTREGKTNLGVGVYFTDAGKIPLLRAVQKAEQIREAAHAARGYLAIEGINAYNQGVQGLLFGASDAGKAIIAEGRSVTAQTLGGTGALKVGASQSPAGAVFGHGLEEY